MRADGQPLHPRAGHPAPPLPPKSLPPSPGVGFHVMFDGDVPHPNVPKWNVKVLGVSKTTRHADATAANAFWQGVEKDMMLRKAYLTK